MARKANKAAAILELLNQGVSSGKIVKSLKVAPSYVWKLKKEMAHKQEEPKPGEYIEVEGQLGPDEIDAVLDARGSRYGDFMSHAEVTQQLKNVMMAHLIKKRKTLVVDQQEALEMIFHKVGRIVNGDPDYADSWLDIAGYAKLVSDRLQGTVR